MRVARRKPKLSASPHRTSFPQKAAGIRPWKSSPEQMGILPISLRCNVGSIPSSKAWATDLIVDDVAVSITLKRRYCILVSLTIRDESPFDETEVEMICVYLTLVSSGDAMRARRKGQQSSHGWV